ncbi:nucleoside hydrolase [Alteromonas sp. S167]|uniref:nucleoside hydrolase n=1 Tax=Alteromonas sp. S167 TaxID=3117402 RepID=UPI002FE42688
MSSKQAVIFDHDGGIDDLLSLLLLLRLPNIEVIGVSITPADCYPDDALLSTKKILNLTNNSHIPVCVGKCVGPNPFPPEWRAQPKMCHAVPVMLRTSSDGIKVIDQPAHIWMKKMIEQHSSKVTVLMTGPATNLAGAIELAGGEPAFVDNVERVIWMGGAIDVKGNVAMHDHNGTAEWNAYWHPDATATLINSSLPVLLVPLDATNALPVSWPFLTSLAKVQSPVSDLAGQFWAATVTAIPSYEFTYFLWDVLSTCIVALPNEHFKVDTAMLAVGTNTPNAGQIYRVDRNLDSGLGEGDGTPHGSEFKGREVSWVSEVNADFVRQMVIHFLSGEFTQPPVTFVN